MTAIFFQSIGKAAISGAISLSRQIIFPIPATVILCARIGVMGVLWAGPAADGLAFILAFVLALGEMRELKHLEGEKLEMAAA